MLIEAAAGHPALPWFRWFIYTSSLLLLLSHAIRTRHARQGKTLYWVAGALLVVGALGSFGVL